MFIHVVSAVLCRWSFNQSVDSVAWRYSVRVRGYASTTAATAARYSGFQYQFQQLVCAPGWWSSTAKPSGPTKVPR